MGFNFSFRFRLGRKDPILLLGNENREFFSEDENFNDRCRLCRADFRRMPGRSWP